MNAAETRKMLEVAAQLFPTLKTPTDEMAAAWAMVLADVPADYAGEIITRCAKSSDFLSLRLITETWEAMYQEVDRALRGVPRMRRTHAAAVASGDLELAGRIAGAHNRAIARVPAPVAASRGFEPLEAQLPAPVEKSAVRAAGGRVASIASTLGAMSE